MNKAVLRILFLIFLCCAVLFGAAVLLYSSRQFPSVNAAVDSTLTACENFFSRFIGKKVEPQEVLPPINIDAPALAFKKPAFMGKFESTLSLHPIEKQFADWELYFRLSDDGYALECEGSLTRYRPDYDGSSAAAESWKFLADYPILTRPGVFSDAVVFITARPELIVLDLFSGSILQVADCPVFPAGPASVNLDSYVFRGGDNKEYSFFFYPDSGGVMPAPEQNNDVSRRLRSLFLPGRDAFESMRLRMRNWNSGVNPTEELPVRILPESSPQPLSAGEPLYVLCPDSSGEYLLGITDTGLAPVTTDAVVALFTENGELLAVSLDYVADRPQLTVNLTKSLFYYAVVLPLGQTPDFTGTEHSDGNAQYQKTVQAREFYLTLKPLQGHN